MRGTAGVVRSWSDDEGWGVIDSSQCPGGCWAHFSALAADSFWEPRAGEHVQFDGEEGDQDGFGFRATRVWPSDRGPVELALDEPGRGSSSHLTTEFE